ncbi:MFS transporter [Streptomyces sp. NBC_01005]|uniref:CynX/NimT family MFS transporter n=1 Tax=Streptomyces TaxID=1883 RepID=UPI00352591A2|nr:MFS transporter [Streptomyces sp. NBC_01005]WTC92757.1 MFS transporter [Streptomyces sp. NBC_01650]
MREVPGAVRGGQLSALLLVGVLLVAANLRAALTGVGPLLPDIGRSTGLSGTWTGLLSTLPLLTFAATSPLVGRTTHRYGAPRTLGLSLAVLAVGLLLRSLPGTFFLFAGTVVVAAAIAYGNVLLPSVVKSTVPEDRISQVTGLYVTAMGFLAAVASGVSVPLADHLPGGWRAALGCWAVLAVLAYAVWAPQYRRTDPATPTYAGRQRIPWRSPLAWQVSLFMGLQSLGFYSTIAWLPSIVHDQGVGEAAAGWQLFLFQVVGLVSSSTLPVLTRRWKDQRILAAAASAIGALGFALLAVAPQLAVVSSVLIGFGGGACLVLALAFQGQRAADASQAAALASMAQSVGYLVAALGPLLLGTLHDLTGGWALPLTVLVALTLTQAVVGAGAGRDLLLKTTSCSSTPVRIGD